MKHLVIAIIVILGYAVNLKANGHKKSNKSYHANKLLSINPYLEMTYARVYRTR